MERRIIIVNSGARTANEFVEEFVRFVRQQIILIPPQYSSNGALKNVSILSAPPTTTAACASTSTSTASESSAARSAGGAAAAEIARLRSIADSLKRARTASTKPTHPASRPLATSVSQADPSIRCSAAIAKTSGAFRSTRATHASVTARQILTTRLHPSAISFAGLYDLVAASLTEFLRRSVVSVRNSLAVAHVMFPLSLTALADFLAKFGAINIPIKINILVNVDIDIAATPVAAAPGVSPRNAEPNTYPKSK